MFDIFFGWPKASKCKKTVKSARCRLRIFKNKRQAIATQSRKDLAELLQNGHEDIAIKRVYKGSDEGFFDSCEEQSIMGCHHGCGNGEPVAKKLVEQLTQDESMVAAYELLDHFCEVILKKLSFIRRHKECPDDINEAVSSLIFASARCGDFPELYVIRKLFGQHYGQKFVTAAVELYPGNLVNKQVMENLSVKFVPDDLKHRVVDEIAGDNCIQPKALAIEYYPVWQQLQVEDCEGYQLVEETRESDVQINETIGGSKRHPSEDEEIKRDIICVDSSMSNTSDNFSVPESCLTDETSALVSTVQQYPPYLSYPSPKAVEKVEDSPEIIYFSASTLENKREVMALTSSSKRPSLPLYAEVMVNNVEEIEVYHFSLSEDGFCQDRMQLDCDESGVDQDNSMSEELSIRVLRKTKRVPRKRSRRRSALFENQCLMDIGYMAYYHKPCRSPSDRKHSYPQKRLEQYSSPEKENGLQLCQCQGSTKRKSFNLDMCNCGLDQPCYCCVYDEQDCLEDLSMKLKRGIVSQYSRALSMPSIEWHKISQDKTLRTYSYSPQRPKHVHPKLPDYEDLYAMFTDLKRERLEHGDTSKEQQLE